MGVVAYNGSRARGQRRWVIAASSVAAAGLLAGCSVSFSSLLGGDDDAIATGSITPPAKQISPLSKDMTAEDWRRASAALAVALDPQGNGQSAGWDNPETKMKGSISPVGAPYVKNDEVCRAFLAATTTSAGQEWAQGAACKPSGGDWTVRDARPWKKPA